MPVTYCDVFSFLWRSIQSMGCFFDCFRVRSDPRHNPRPHLVPNSSPSPPTEDVAEKLRLSSLFAAEEKDQCVVKEQENLVRRVGKFQISDGLLEEMCPNMVPQKLKKIEAFGGSRYKIIEEREYLALTGSRLNGMELITLGLATHFVPSEKLPDLEKKLVSLNKGNKDTVKPLIEQFSSKVQIDVIDECFSKDSVEEIIQSFEAASLKEGNGWMIPVLKGLKRSSPTGLKITLRSIRQGRGQTLAECLKTEFRLTINILHSMISDDVYEGIRALTIDKDNTPKWDPSSLDKVDDEDLDKVFSPYEAHLELQIPESEECRWDGKYEKSAYGISK